MANNENPFVNICFKKIICIINGNKKLLDMEIEPYYKSFFLFN